MSENVQTEAKAPPGPKPATPPAADQATTTATATTEAEAAKKAAKKAKKAKKAAKAAEVDAIIANVEEEVSHEKAMLAAMRRSASAQEGIARALQRNHEERLAALQTPASTAEKVFTYALGGAAVVGGVAVAVTLAATAVNAIRGAFSDDDDHPALPPGDHEVTGSSSMESL